MFLILFNILVLGFVISSYNFFSKNNWGKSINISIIINSFFVLIITELLSFSDCLKSSYVIRAWVFLLLVSTFWFFHLLKKNGANLQILKNIQFGFMTKKFIFLSCVIFLLLGLIFIQGVIYPPNNYDSMTYHMSRILHWISNFNVSYYPSHIIRQLYQPPFSEFFIMHFNMISENDLYSNSVQFFFLIGIVNLFLLIINHLFIGTINVYYLIILLISIPELILQASSTQNDIVVSFFIISSIFYLFEFVQKNSYLNLVLFSLSIGFALLTKGTAYIYCLPIIFVFIILIVRNFKNNFKTLLINCCLLVFLILIVNANHYYRNYKFSKSFLGTSSVESSMYKNINIGPITTLSNIVKNAGNHFSIFNSSNKIDEVIYKIHDFLGIGINNENVNFGNLRYTNFGHTLPLHEDYASNTIHFLLIIISLIIFIILLIKRKKINRKIIILIFILLSQILFFNIYLKWQPWHTRLQTPIFIISTLIIFYFLFYRLKMKIFHFALNIFLVLMSFLIVLHNETRPLLNKNFHSLFQSRYKNYFVNNPDLFNEYQNVHDQLIKYQIKKVGLFINGDDFEYPLFYDNYTRKINICHIKVDNYSSKIQFNKNDIECVISSKNHQKLFSFNNKKYINITNNNKKIWLYLKI